MTQCRGNTDPNACLPSGICHGMLSNCDALNITPTSPQFTWPWESATFLGYTQGSAPGRSSLLKQYRRTLGFWCHFTCVVLTALSSLWCPNAFNDGMGDGQHVHINTVYRYLVKKPWPAVALAAILPPEMCCSWKDREFQLVLSWVPMTKVGAKVTLYSTSQRAAPECELLVAQGNIVVPGTSYLYSSSYLLIPLPCLAMHSYGDWKWRLERGTVVPTTTSSDSFSEFIAQTCQKTSMAGPSPSFELPVK